MGTKQVLKPNQSHFCQGLKTKKLWTFSSETPLKENMLSEAVNKVHHSEKLIDPILRNPQESLFNKANSINLTLLLQFSSR